MNIFFPIWVSIFIGSSNAYAGLVGTCRVKEYVAYASTLDKTIRIDDTTVSQSWDVGNFNLSTEITGQGFVSFLLKHKVSKVTAVWEVVFEKEPNLSLTIADGNFFDMNCSIK